MRPDVYVPLVPPVIVADGAVWQTAKSWPVKSWGSSPGGSSPGRSSSEAVLRD